MSSVTYDDGDLLTCDAQYIAHQCNCKTRHAAGLAKKVFRRYPNANTYKKRNKNRRLGRISVHGRVINMYAQINPGRSKTSHRLREDAFAKCLEAIGKIEGIKSVAFPHQIGCGLAGGVWDRYKDMIESFAADHPDIKVSVIRLIH